MNELQLLQKIKDYLRKVHDMREAQKEYFKSRSTTALIRSKEYEKVIDSDFFEVTQAAYDLHYMANEVQKMIENTDI